MRDDDQDWPPAPDPSGPMPDGWRPIEWVAYGLFATGGASIRDVADEMQMSPGSVSVWRRKWRKRYGPGLLAEETARRREENAAERNRRAVADAATAVAPWKEHRANLASLMGRNAGEFLKTVARMLERFNAQLDEGQPVTASDLETMVATTDRLALIADRLSGIPDPNRARLGAGVGIGAGPGGAPVPKGVVAALEGSADPGRGSKDTLAAAKKALEGLQAMKARAIEVEAKEA